MIYLGGKRRIAEQILTVILAGRKDGQYYVEPFCGGCDMIDKVPGNRIANDSNPYLIAMREALSWGRDPPKTISRERYREVRTCHKQNSGGYPMRYIGWVGFTGSFNSKFFGGYAGHPAMNAVGGVRDRTGEAIRNILAQVPLIGGVQFTNRSYNDMGIPPNSIIYRDPPYAGVTKCEYSIDHEDFWERCGKKAAEGHEAFVSEYNAPDDFVCVWGRKLRVCVNPGIGKQAVEKLFIHKSRV